MGQGAKGRYEKSVKDKLLDTVLIQILTVYLLYSYVISMNISF